MFVCALEMIFKKIFGKIIFVFPDLTSFTISEVNEEDCENWCLEFLYYARLDPQIKIGFVLTWCGYCAESEVSKKLFAFLKKYFSKHF